MRTRTKTNELVMQPMGKVHIAYRNLNGTPIGNYDYGPISPIIGSSDEESMTDDISKSRESKMVFHQKRIFRRNRLDAEEYYLGSTPNQIWNVSGPGAHWISWGNYGDINHSNIQVSWSMPEESLIRKAKDAFNNRNEVDNLLNVTEAPELVTSLKPLHNKLNGVRLWPDDDIKSMKRTLLKNAKFNLGFLCGGYLYYSFGVAPLVNDMRKISRQVDAYKQKLARALKRAGTEETVRVRDTGIISQKLIASSGGTFPYAYGEDTQMDGSWWHTKPYSLVVPTRICTVRGTRSIKYQTPFFGELDYLASRFGVTGPASFLWERVKFSFVLDWFVDLSDVLNTIDNTLTGNTKGIRDITLSEKWQVLCPVIKHLRAAGQQSSADGQQTALVELSQYHRKPIIDSTNVGLSGRFGKKQASLTAALVGQMAANLKSKVRR